METIKSIFDFLTGLGSPVMLPIIIFILGLILGQKISRAFISAITVGVGFIGLGLVITLLFDALGPATAALVEATGIQLNALDVGWGVAAAIAFGTVVGSLVFIVALGVNLIMLVFRWTKTLNVDMWNYWHYAFTGSLVYLVTGGNLVLGLIAAAIHAIVSLLIADWTAKDVQEFFKIPGVSIPQGWAVTSVPIIKGLNWIVEKIPGLRDIYWDSEGMQKKLGVFGQPIIMGATLGLLFGLIAYGFSTKVLTVAVQMAAVMLLIPRIIAIFMEGLTPLSEAAREFMQKRFAGREFYIGLDSAILIGHPITIAAGILLIPITLLLAAILPGNNTLPAADLAATAFFICMVPPLTRGNFFRSILYGTIIMVMVLYISSAFAPLLTQIASDIGYAIPEGAVQITGLSGGNWIAWILTTISGLFGG
ncbi:MAG: PTS galactitol transporter subunit IIC [Anaerolineales bacterium]|nr:MAG: PTS galactitol transporter subunit IIC [Chloroflexota bacterium]MBE7433073.1 PTS galactitol transporter subunit IIC [Anaerolineales bacterium]MCE7859613.1 PTS galactitol transporter subunit IIC [Chloroflexi bacterium CFX2]MCK6582261.1 PTS galactitol transporter subunit IIC [Anaerolineales bacterium]GJQ34665.1 MAG: PTS galactitol transporter subunit IIC [Anaerolineaceae bacterium]